MGGGREAVRVSSLIQGLITGIRPLRLQGATRSAGKGGGDRGGRKRRGGGEWRLRNDSGDGVKGQQGLEVAGETL